MASYDGVPIFGRSVNIKMVPNPSRKVYTEFFGLDGVFSLFGGSRGRMFFCSGILAGVDALDLSSIIGLILSYDDGIGRVLVDTMGNAWPAVQFDRFEPGERFMSSGDACFIDYRLTFTGLI